MTGQQWAYVIPGSLLLLGLMHLFSPLRQKIGIDRNVKFDYGGVWVFIVLSFATGGLLQELGRAAIFWESIRGFEAGYATNDVLREHQDIISLYTKDKLLEKVKKDLNVARGSFDMRNADWLVTWRGVITRMYASVLERADFDKRAAGLAQIQRDVALYLDLCTAFMLLFFCSLARSAYLGAERCIQLCSASKRAHTRPNWLKAMQGWRNPIGLNCGEAAILALAMVIAWAQMEHSNRLFARDLFLAYLYPVG